MSEEPKTAQTRPDASLVDLDSRRDDVSAANVRFRRAKADFVALLTVELRPRLAFADALAILKAFDSLTSAIDERVALLDARMR